MGLDDIREQLAALRKRVSAIDRKYADGPPRRPLPFSPPALLPEDSIAAGSDVPFHGLGDEIENASGKHLQTEKFYERHRRYGDTALWWLRNSGQPLPASQSR